ncbi:MAG: aryl-sulfate sulfotransferase [Chloroflexota bacterium]
MANQVKYRSIPHIITRQSELEQAFLAEFEAGDYTLDNPLVKVDPYGICPLTAMLLFKTPVPTEVTITVRGKKAPGDIRHTFPASTSHVLPVYGLYAGYDNTVEISTANGRQHASTITTAPLRPDVVPASSIKTTPEYFGQNLIFLTSSIVFLPATKAHTLAVGLDYAGDVRWHSSIPLGFDIKRMPNGHILVGTERLVKAPYFTSGLYEMAFSGKVFKEYRIPSGYHHDHFVMEDGNILVLSFDAHSHTVEDMCVLIDPRTGAILKTWDYKTVLPQNVAGSGDQEPHDWFHNNAVWYDKKTNSLTISGRHQDAVINIDFDSGKLNWIIGDPDGWPRDIVDRYFFTPVGDGEFDWQYEQHACVMLPDGDVMLLDNGHFRSKNKDKWILNRDNFSRGVRYRIDTETMTIRQVWQYGKERGAEFFSPYISNVEYYDEGHYMVHSGGIGYENGETCEGMAVMKLMLPEFKDSKIELRSITCEIKDGELVYEMHLEGNYYRAEKLPLYHANETAELGQGQVLGSLIDTSTTETKLAAKETGQLVPEHYQASVVEEEDRFTFSAIFDTGEVSQLLMIDEAGETRRYQINSAPQPFQVPSAGTPEKAAPLKVETIVNKTGLSGAYEVKLVAQGEVFETGVRVAAGQATAGRVPVNAAETV